MNDIHIDNHDPTDPKLPNSALVCRTTQFWTGKLAGVIVDRTAGMIHFQNCYMTRWPPALKSQTKFSCPLSDLRYARQTCHKGRCSLTITTTKGSAHIPSDVSSYQELCEVLAAVIPPRRGLIRDGSDVIALAASGAFGSWLAGFGLLSRNASNVTHGSLAIVGAMLSFLFGNWLLNRR